MAKYTIDIKPSARRELENLSDSLIARLVRKIEAWPPIQGRPAAGNCAVTRICGASASGRTVSYIIDDDRKMVSVTRIAHQSIPILK